LPLQRLLECFLIQMLPVCQKKKRQDLLTETIRNKYSA
jgi:hypothetical protein